MTPLQTLLRAQVPADWTTPSAGLLARHGAPPMVTREDIVDYARSTTAGWPPNQLVDVAALANEDPTDWEAVDRILDRLTGR